MDDFLNYQFPFFLLHRCDTRFQSPILVAMCWLCSSQPDSSSLRQAAVVSQEIRGPSSWTQSHYTLFTLKFIIIISLTFLLCLKVLLYHCSELSIFCSFLDPFQMLCLTRSFYSETFTPNTEKLILLKTFIFITSVRL